MFVFMMLSCLTNNLDTLTGSTTYAGFEKAEFLNSMARWLQLQMIMIGSRDCTVIASLCQYDMNGS